jgi:hypothetical protein
VLKAMKAQNLSNYGNLENNLDAVEQRVPPTSLWGQAGGTSTSSVQGFVPPKGVDSVLEHFPSNQRHLVPPTWGYPDVVTNH